MKKFFVALAVLFCVTGNNFVSAAENLTPEQFDQIVSTTLQTPTTKSLNLDVATFQQNFNAFMTDFISQMNAGDDAEMLRQAFLINEPKVLTKDGDTIFAKSFFGNIAIIGSLDENGKFKVINFFATQSTDKNDTLISVMILNAFVKGVSPELDATNLLTEAKETSSGIVTRGDFKFSFSKKDNVNAVSVTAN